MENRSALYLFFSTPSCAKLNKVMLRKGNATHDQVCLEQLPTYLTPSTLSIRFSNETNNFDLRMLKENLVTSASGDLLSVTATENPSSTPEEEAQAPTSAKGEMATGGNRHSIHSLQHFLLGSIFGKHNFYVGTSCKSPLTCEMVPLVLRSNT